MQWQFMRQDVMKCRSMRISRRLGLNIKMGWWQMWERTRDVKKIEKKRKELGISGRTYKTHWFFQEAITTC